MTLAGELNLEDWSFFNPPPSISVPDVLLCLEFLTFPSLFVRLGPL